jgi:LacI family transcriptional regulator
LEDAVRQVAEARLQLVYLEEEELPVGGHAVVQMQGSPASNDLLTAERLADRFLQLAPRPTAAVVSDESGAHVVMGILRKHGIRVPEDLSMACFGATFLSEYGAVPLTTVEQPLREMARNAVDLVIRQVDPASQPQPEARILPARLIQRNSVAHLHGDPLSGGENNTRGTL